MRAIALIFVCLLSACADGTGTAPARSVLSGHAPASSHIVAFMGDSITAGFDIKAFTSLPTLNFGVSGQTTDQMLSRFGSEVLEANPGVVVILGGTNDIAAGYEPDEIISNIKTMAARATAQGIKVILCSVTRTVVSEVRAPWSHEYLIVDLNERILDLASEQGYLYADYYDVLVLPDGTADPSLFVDGLHPNAAGQARMWSVLQPLLAEDIALSAERTPQPGR